MFTGIVFHHVVSGLIEADKFSLGIVLKRISAFLWVRKLFLKF